MWLITGLKAIGGFFKKVFRGLVGVFVEDFNDITQQAIKLLLFSAAPGSEKFEMALSILKGFAIKEGKTFVNHAARMLIELKLFEVKAEAEGVGPQAKLEGLIDLGLEEARKAVAAVNETALMGDSDRRQLAFKKLWNDLEAAGKTVLLDSNLINVLIELAVAEVKGLAAD